MNDDILQKIADATGMYVAFPKRWPDEDSASYIHLFYKEPYLDKDGEWTDGTTPTSFNIEDKIPFSVRKINPKDSLRKPIVSSWENYLYTGKFLNWDFSEID